MDFGDVVVHVFREQERAFYGLERLWGDAPRLDWRGKLPRTYCASRESRL
jgi:ribosomal silencing factor RsfS